MRFRAGQFTAPEVRAIREEAILTCLILSFGPLWGRRSRPEQTGSCWHIVPDMWLAQNGTKRDWRIKGL